MVCGHYIFSQKSAIIRDVRKYFVFGTVGVILFLSTFSSTALSVALPTIHSSFHTSLIMVGWVMSGYLLTLTISVALGGRLSDTFGQKPVFMSCLLLFILGTLLCPLAPNVELLILFRLIQGLGAGALASCSVGIVSSEFPNARQKAVGLLISIYPFGMIAGPNIGGWVTSAWGWRWLFWVNLPVLVAAFVVAALLLRPGKRAQSYLDLPGVAMVAGFLSAIMVGLSLIKADGTPWILVAALITIGIAIIVIFIRREGRVPDPIIDLEFLKGRRFAASNVYNSIYGACTSITAYFVPMYAVYVYHETTLKSGAITTPRSAAMLLVSSITSFYLTRWGYRWPMVIGTAAMGFSFVFLAIEPQSVDILGWHLGGTSILLLVMALSGLALGAIATSASNACIDLKPERAATITGIRMMFMNSGASVVTVVVSLILNSNKDVSHGFTLVFSGLALLIFISIPLIFAMPGRPTALTSSKNTG